MYFGVTFAKTTPPITPGIAMCHRRRCLAAEALLPMAKHHAQADIGPHTKRPAGMCAVE
jgi:hypothetical protein